MFQVTVGNAGNSVAELVPPKNFTLNGDMYTCSSLSKIAPTLYPQDSGRRFTQAFASFRTNCTYSETHAEVVPGCCVSFSSFYNDTVIPCPSCSCACGRFSSNTSLCDVTNPASPYLHAAPAHLNIVSNPYARECSLDGCPADVHWHVAANYYGYWEVLLTISNRMLYKTAANWTLAVEHPGLSNITTLSNFNARNILVNGVNDTSILYGLTDVSDVLAVAPGYLQGSILMGKSDEAFSLQGGWPFPRKVVFDGLTCVMPTSFPAVPPGSWLK
eukprot:TRINITY_DN5670_c0_g1_i2.p1 TRINITY_DN5670_c0_g1~~TRINITY_DN5670_c0_g1_i2.p1  ORF type:complete len:273 (+),score=34.99 TRINITY_DN5670_c0_g1_i2:578-1396(+)